MFLCIAIILPSLGVASYVFATPVITPETAPESLSDVPPSVPTGTQITSPVDFNFAAGGDWRCNDNTMLNVRNIIAEDPEIVLGLGDYSYDESADCWLAIFDPIINKTKIALGNHDTEEFPGLLEEYMSAFNLTQQYYSFDYENVHFLVMATDWALDRYDEGSRQHTFVVNDLTKAASNPNTEWIVVLYHNVGYTPPNNGANGHDTLIEYHELFQRFGVDMVLQGHVHAYSRTYPISFNPTYMHEPIVEFNGSNYYPNPVGQVYAIVGTGGAGFHDLFAQAPYEAYQQNTAPGFLNVDVINNGLTFNASFIAANGTVLDNFIIDKSVVGPERGIPAGSVPAVDGVPLGVNQSGSLLIDIGVGDTSVSSGDIQTITANVFASDSPETTLGNAAVEVSVLDPSGEDIYEFSDGDGTVVTELAIEPGFPEGLYTIEVESSAPGYGTATEFLTFTVTG